MVFSGATLVAENGAVIAAGERFVRDTVLTIADIDVEKLNAQRQSNMSFENLSNEIGFSKITIDNESNDLNYRFVDPHPFVPADDEKRRESRSPISRSKHRPVLHQEQNCQRLAVGHGLSLDSLIELL